MANLCSQAKLQTALLQCLSRACSEAHGLVAWHTMEDDGDVMVVTDLSDRSYLAVKPRAPGVPYLHYSFKGGLLVQWQPPLPGAVDVAGNDIGV